MKKIFALILSTSIVAGCSTYSQQGEMIGMTAGAIIGNQVGGGMGQVAATVIGAAVGANAGRTVGAGLDNQRSGGTGQYVPQYRSELSYGPDYSVCTQYQRYSEIRRCRDGVRRGYENEIRKREQEAYRAGMNSQRY